MTGRQAPHQWLGLCPAQGLVPHHGPMGASVSSDVQVQGPGRSASPCSPDHTALALSQGEWVLPGATDLHRDVGLAAVTHSLTQPFDPLLFLKSKQQSGNRPNSSGIGPRTGSPFFKKIYFLFFFFKTTPKANPQPLSSWFATRAPLRGETLGPSSETPA